MAGILRPLLGHREVRVLCQQLRADQVRRVTNAAGRLAVIPISADIILALQTLHFDPVLDEILNNRQPRRPGADDAICSPARCVAISSRRTIAADQEVTSYPRLTTTNQAFGPPALN